MEGAGVAEAEGVGVTEGDGLGKLAAAAKVLPEFKALSEKSPKTDSFKANNIRHIKNEKRKYVLRIFNVVIARPRSGVAILMESLGIKIPTSLRSSG